MKPWYKQDRLLKGLEGVVSDSNANWLGRNSGLEAMKDLGAPKATFERVQKKYATATSGDDAQVKRKVEEILKTM